MTKAKWQRLRRIVLHEQREFARLFDDATTVSDKQLYASAENAYLHVLAEMSRLIRSAPLAEFSRQVRAARPRRT